MPGAPLDPNRKLYLLGLGLSPERVAMIYQVPYWLLTGEPRPNWLRRPIWRIRALRWRWDL